VHRVPLLRFAAGGGARALVTACVRCSGRRTGRRLRRSSRDNMMLFIHNAEYCVNAAAACTCAAHVDSPPQWRDMRPWDADTRIASRPARGQRRLRRRRRRTARTSWARGAAAGSRAVAMMRR